MSRRARAFHKLFPGGAHVLDFDVTSNPLADRIVVPEVRLQSNARLAWGLRSALDTLPLHGALAISVH